MKPKHITDATDSKIHLSSLRIFSTMNNIISLPGPSVMEHHISAPAGGIGTNCFRCGHDGADVRMIPCGCSAHARCIQIRSEQPITQCPNCSQPVTGISLYPMSFQEIDNARRLAANQVTKRGKKRRVPTTSDTLDLSSTSSEANHCRTGRWTPEEMSFCDKLIDRFKAGELPVPEGVKLNDFLASMLKSKQSRLTKKMKNANLSGKAFKVTTGYISDVPGCQEFSEQEESFFRSLNDPVEQATVKFHMQKEWREMFSGFCVAMGQPLDADAWLSSVEEMEKRESLAKDAARMTRRKLMMGIALNRDAQNPDTGVFINHDPHGINTSGIGIGDGLQTEQDEFLSLLNDKFFGGPKQNSSSGKYPKKANVAQRHYWHYASPFLGKVVSYLQRHACPFEHVDAWVPSFVPDSEASEGSGNNSNSTCRLCFAGSATAEVHVPIDGSGSGSSMPLSQDDQFNLLSFGEYSQKFSFNVGCGLPGRVYENGVPAWEQSVQNAPHQHFERCGGAIQWKIKTVVGIPVPSPNVGRIVVVLYSRFDRNKDQDMVSRLHDEFTKLVPSPKWKLVVDIGRAQEPSPTPEKTTSFQNNMAVSNTKGSDQSVEITKDARTEELVALLGEHMPHDPNSPYSSFLSGLMSLRLMLLKPTRTDEEKEIEGTLLSSYTSYLSSGRSKQDITLMIARDFMFLKQQPSLQQPAQDQHTQQHHYQQPLQPPQQQQLQPPQHQHALNHSNSSVMLTGYASTNSITSANNGSFPQQVQNTQQSSSEQYPSLTQ